MRTIKITDLITKSIDRTRLILFQPFVLKKWLRLLFIAVLAGAISASSLGGSSGRSTKKAEAALETYQSNQAMVTSGASSLTSSTTSVDRFNQDFKTTIRRAVAYFSGIPFIFLIAIFSLMTILIVTGIMLLMWLNARFKFVWLHAIIHNDAAIAKPFRDYRKEGDSLFKLSIVVGILFFVFLGFMMVWGYGSLVWAGFLKRGVVTVAPAITSLIAEFVIFISAIIFVCLWGVFVDHFVAPIMMLNRETYLPSWRKFSTIYKNNRGDFWLYLMVLLGLGIVSSMLEGIMFVIVMIAGIFIAGAIIGIGYFAFSVLLKAKIVFFGFAIGAGIPMLVVFVIAMFSIVLPFAVFFRGFSLYFLASLNEGYAPLALNESQGER